MTNVHFLHLVNFTEFRPLYIRYYSGFFIFFIWSISQNSFHSTYATTLFQVGKFAKIVLRVLVFLSSRDRAPFFPGFVLVIHLL